MTPPDKDVWNGDYTCINIDCDKNIPAHIVEKQFTHPKNRVCSSCKSSPIIRWRCIGCDGIINNTVKRSGMFYCSVMCRIHSNHVRTYAKVIKPVIIKNIVGCNYCTKALTHSHKLKFCDSKCLGLHKKLEVHKRLYKADIIKRANARMLAKNPNYDKEKRVKHKKKQQLYQKRRYNVLKLVQKVRDKQTHI